MPESEVFIPPLNLGEWNLDIINRLVELKYPETDSLEFKQKIPKDFENDLSAFANSSGGIIVLGIKGKNKAEEKVGISSTNENEVVQTLTGKATLLDPNLTITTKPIEDGSNFYLAIKIENTNSKPFIIRNTGGCYIRLNGTTQPASKAIVINLFSENLGRIQRLTALKNAVKLVGDELSLRKRNGQFQVRRDYVQNISEIDLFFIKSSVVNALDLISGLADFGSITQNSYTTGLVTTTIPRLEELNANIRGFNQSDNDTREREVFSNWLNLFDTQHCNGLIASLERCKSKLDEMIA